MSRTVRAYCITAEAVAREKERSGGNFDDVDVSKVIELDKLELRDVGPRDVHLRILAASAEHNVDHAALADTVNIAEARGGRMYPGNSALGEVLDVGAARDGSRVEFVPERQVLEDARRAAVALPDLVPAAALDEPVGRGRQALHRRPAQDERAVGEERAEVEAVDVGVRLRLERLAASQRDDVPPKL